MLLEAVVLAWVLHVNRTVNTGHPIEVMIETRYETKEECHAAALKASKEPGVKAWCTGR